MNSTFTLVFLVALALATATRLWLAARQSRYVLARRDAVPDSFAGVIPLAAHQKAADYTVAKVKLGTVEMAVGVVWVLVLTIGGLLQLFANQWARAWSMDSIAHGTALILSVFLLQGAVSMPLEGIEGRLAELHMLTGQPVLYCRSGDKTKDMAEKLAEQGVPVAFLEGGLLAWEAEGLPIER